MTKMMIFAEVAMSLACTVASSVAARAASLPGEFQTVDAHKSNTVRADLGAAWATYGTVVVKPAVYEPAKRGQQLTDGQEQKLRSAVDSSLKAAFSDKLNGTGRVLEVRPVITGVRRANLFVNVVSFAAVQAPVSYGAASVRYDLFDSATGTQVAEIASKRCAGPWNIYPWQMLQAFQPVGHASTLLKRDSKMLRKDLEKMARAAQ